MVVWIVGRLGGLIRRSWGGVAIAGVAVLLALYGYWFFTAPDGAGDTAVQVEIRPGTGFHSLADTLAELKLIRYPLLFRIAGRISRIDRTLHVGMYAFSAGESPYQVLRTLAEHKQVYLQFTAVEGTVIRELLPEISDKLGIPIDSLRTAVRDPRRRTRMGTPVGNLEGYLFPETYTIPWGASAGDVVDAMLDQFDSVWNRVSAAYHGDLTRHQAVTLASLIEAEAREGGERRLISSVFHNRLKRRMRLQCDPTIIYAMGGLDRPLMRKDWEFDSPYNTYLVFGLPPGPIGNPGEASLRAALYPDTTSYLYFVARGDGSHKFSKTLAEHEAAFREIKNNRHSRR